jgi:hypothetical protein
VDRDENMYSNSDFQAEDEASRSTSCLHGEQDFTMSLEDKSALPFSGAGTQLNQLPHIQVEEVPDEGEGLREWNQGVDESRFIKLYPDPAGVPIHVGQSSTKFEKILEAKEESTQWGDFKTKGEWQLAKWLLQNTCHNQIANFLDLPIVHSCLCL